MTTLVTILCASIGYGTESIFGFGGSVVTFLLLSSILPGKEIIALLPSFAVVGGVLILLSDRTEADWHTIARICRYAIPGLLIGVFLMDWISDSIITVVVLVVSLVFGIATMRGSEPQPPPHLRALLYGISGIMIGATSLGILFIPIIKADLGGRRNFRASLALLWLITALFRYPLYALQGILDPEGMLTGLLAVPFLIIAITPGFRIHLRIPERSYKKYVGAAISVVAAVNLIMRITAYLV